MKSGEMRFLISWEWFYSGLKIKHGSRFSILYSGVLILFSLTRLYNQLISSSSDPSLKIILA